MNLEIIRPGPFKFCMENIHGEYKAIVTIDEGIVKSEMQQSALKMISGRMEAHSIQYHSILLDGLMAPVSQMNVKKVV
jgi:hypothetical protein